MLIYYCISKKNKKNYIFRCFLFFHTNYLLAAATTLPASHLLILAKASSRFNASFLAFSCKERLTTRAQICENCT
jgi:hypothetical protein